MSGAHEVASFSNQKDALTAIEKTAYDLALIDVNLKKETSIDVATKCKEKQIPFIYITGYGNSFKEEETFPDAPVLLKPVDLETLKNIINTHLL